MDLTVSLPQLAKMFDRLDAIDKKLDALILAATTPGPVQVEQPADPDTPTRGSESKRVTRKVTRRANANGEDYDDREDPEEQEDEETLLARTEFEATHRVRLASASRSSSS
jgi:hypothetical protein